MSRHSWLQKIAKVYIDIMRGTPVLVLLMLMYYVVTITFRITHSEQSGVTALDFMVENMEASPLSEKQRSELSLLCKQVVEEPTERGFRVKLIV